jgi:hypothetical protein
MEDTSRLYQTVQDNKSSRIQATLPFSIYLYVKKTNIILHRSLNNKRAWQRDIISFKQLL